MRAKPTADSEAPIVSKQKLNSSPTRSSEIIEKQIKFKFNANNKSSKDINKIITFFLLKIIPKEPIINNNSVLKNQILLLK